jgi:hypothetical protein
MQNHQAVLSTFQFRRTADVIRVFNENWYLMAEYSERTGTVKWQRVLIATQRELIEKWLRERYPALAPPTVSASPDTTSVANKAVAPSRPGPRVRRTSPRARVSQPRATRRKN